VLLEPPLPLPLPWLPLPLSEANAKAAAVVAMMAIAVLVSFFMMISLRKMKRSFVKCQRLIFDRVGKFQKDMATVFGFLSLFSLPVCSFSICGVLSNSLKQVLLQMDGKIRI
jgi:membrane protease YdiL (CAAX protease family)